MHCTCLVTEAVCMGVLLHGQDTWHSRKRAESSSQGSICGRYNLHHVVLQPIHCEFILSCVSEMEVKQ